MKNEMQIRYYVCVYLKTAYGLKMVSSMLFAHESDAEAHAEESVKGERKRYVAVVTPSLFSGAEWEEEFGHFSD